jgi:hypothetical protein
MCSPCSKIIDQPCTIQPYFLQQAEICERQAKRKCQNENWEVGWEMGLRRGKRNSQHCLPSSLALSEFIIASSASSNLVFQKPVNYSSWGGVVVTEEELLSGYWEKDNTIMILGVCAWHNVLPSEVGKDDNRHTWRLRRVERDSSPIWYNGLGVQFQSNVGCIGSMAERAQHYCHQKTCYSRKQYDGTIHTMI